MIIIPVRQQTNHSVSQQAVNSNDDHVNRDIADLSGVSAAPVIMGTIGAEYEDTADNNTQTIDTLTGDYEPVHIYSNINTGQIKVREETSSSSADSHNEEKQAAQYTALYNEDVNKN